jgi:uncharacterized protein (DUF1015 family)
MSDPRFQLARPFAALRPRADAAADVIAPPYDVVSTEEARALAAGRPHSFLRISRPEIDLEPGADPYSDRAYANGAANLTRLVADGVLVRDASPAYYVYRMRDGAHSQTGIAFAASVAAYEHQRVRRHELTRPDKENDRVRNITTLNAQTGPVLCAYRSEARIATLIGQASSAPPLLDADGPQQVRHSVWRVDDPALHAELATALNALECLYIADGHHRAAAAARVASAKRAAGSDPDASHEGFLVVAFPHDEMRILDYNRVVRDLGGLDAAALLNRAGREFRVAPAAQRVQPAAPRSFGMYLAGRWYRLDLPPDSLPGDDPVASLDVSLLQDRLLAPVLGIEDPRTDPRIDFVGGIRGPAELEHRVDSGTAAVAFALHPTRMEQLMAVADAALLMPPKSTWFEPKLADGLLTHLLD